MSGTEDRGTGGRGGPSEFLTSAAWAAFWCAIWKQEDKKGEGREGREGERGNQDDGTGVEFTHPAARARYWRDESLVLLKSRGGLGGGGTGGDM